MTTMTRGNKRLKSERPKEPIRRKKTLECRFNKVMTWLYNFFSRNGLTYQSLGSDESLHLLLKTKKSYIRFGNGESEILIGMDMGTQVYDKALKDALEEIIVNYGPDSNYLLGLTNWCLTQSVKELKSSPGQIRYRIWRFMRFLFWKLDMSRIDMPFLEADMLRTGEVGLSVEKIETLWEDVSHIVMIYNNEAGYDSFKEAHSGKKVYFIKIPDKNFFQVLPETQRTIISLIKENNIERDDVVVLAAAGPGAGVLCYNLCQKDSGIRCYDIGNYIYMHY